MKATSVFIYFAASACLAISSLGFAQAPSGSTGQCKDGSYTSAENKRGACKGHGGVKEWYASENKSEEKSAKSGTKSSESKTTSTSASTTAAPAPAAPAKTSTTSTATKTSQGMRAEAAPGGGAGKVWVNTSSHVYHCTGDEWYGKTKAGEYMTEAEAKAKGAHAAHGKACS
ncbi:MAG TPA: DUF3761 domain-containing protein [Casimicrobiaceae bacterium]|nr:DUF3761 domain-containing protein [Casimicrobiaceae bacterium]